MIGMVLRWPMYGQILLALGAAVVMGILVPADVGLAGVSLLSVLDFVGTLFLNALKMIIVPLIISSIIVGVGALGSSSLGFLGGKTLLYYATSSFFAIVTGLLLVNLIEPGLLGNGTPMREVLSLHADTGAVTEKVSGHGGADLVGVLLRMLPPNIVTAAAEGQMLGLIVFSLLFGYFMARVSPAGHTAMQAFFSGMQEVMMKITNLIMRFAPVGVFALVGKVVLVSGVGVFVPMASFLVTVLAALALHMFVTLPLALSLFGVDPKLHYRAMLSALLTAFSTSSSSATLPVTMGCVSEKSGVSKKVTGFVLPLGATINMDGTALYECVAVLFLAQAYGVDLTLAQQATVVLLALLTSVGVAGIPSASLVAIVLILGVVGLPAEAIGLLLVVDRILDMCRTATNVFGDSCGAVIVARSEGEQTSVSR